MYKYNIICESLLTIIFMTNNKNMTINNKINYFCRQNFSELFIFENFHFLIFNKNLLKLHT